LIKEESAMEITEKVAYPKGLAEGMELDAVSDDLEDVEDLLYGDGDEDGEDEDEYELDDLGEDEECYATTCPTCEETIYFDESILEDGQVICPNCGEKLEFDLGDLEDGEDEEDDGE